MTKLATLTALIALAASPALPCHVIVHPGGPYVAECDPNPVTIQLDGSQTHSCVPGPLFFVWTTDCPGARMDSATAVRPRMTLSGPPPCPIECTVTLTVFDANGRDEEAHTTVTVHDTQAPLVNVELAPREPMAPGPAASACSAPRARTLVVGCAAEDACDPTVTAPVTALRVTTCDGATGTPRDETVAIACGEALRVELERRPCVRSPRPPRPAVSVDSTGLKVVHGLAVVLEGAATDACGNPGGGTFDPAHDAPSACLEHLADGTCCAPLRR